MKQIIAIIQPHRLDAVEHALQSLSHLPGFTLFQVRGHARGRGIGHLFAADEWNPDMHEHTALLMFCSDDIAQEVVEAIRSASHTGNTGDGLIAVSTVDDIVRIQSGERGNAAL
ncbi:transcriptional regulator [Herminiimonas sp. KBW02]|uniref:P-II family nitrogen regulator n=1 Tax=Herminiimonas glaciei TaxID=523788 RepID=A0ABW2I8V4_9BURK|nr:P-II family nitrogen regulator [Herminiimonas sp. KBW02]RQO36466.1 transcriptional regulator [Herminiimonas sp. KBW02]